MILWGEHKLLHQAAVPQWGAGVWSDGLILSLCSLCLEAIQSCKYLYHNHIYVDFFTYSTVLAITTKQI